MKIKFNFSTIGFMICALIVGAGWVYAFASKDSYIVQQMQATPLFIKLFSIIPFGAVVLIAIKGGQNPDLVGHKALPYLLGIFVSLILGIGFLIGFGNYTY